MRKEPDKCFEDIKSISILFDDNTSHANVIGQFVDKLAVHKFASKHEIIENLRMADILLGDQNDLVVA